MSVATILGYVPKNDEKKNSGIKGLKFIILMLYNLCYFMSDVSTRYNQYNYNLLLDRRTISTTDNWLVYSRS